MGWVEIPVLEFYGIKPTHRPQIMLHADVTATALEGSLVRFATICSRGKVERDESKSSFAVQLIFEAENMLVALRACLELESSVDTKILIVDPHVAVASGV
jgi:hypothetical protein